MKRSIPLSLALTLVFAGLSMSIVFADELEAEEAVISETAIDDTDLSASEESIEISSDEVSDDDLTADTEELIDSDNMAIQPIEENNTAGETVTDGVYKGVVNADGTVTVTGLVDGINVHDLNNLIVPNQINGREVTSIGDAAFYQMVLSGGVEGNLVIPDSVISIGDWAFYQAEFDGGIYWGNSIKTIGDKAFYNCYFCGDKLQLPDSVEKIGESAFERLDICASTLKLGRNLTTIGESAFKKSPFTDDLIIPDRVVKIGDNAFEDCDFERLKLGKNVETIGDNAFAENLFSGELALPNSVKTIGGHAFEGCDFERLKLGKNVETIGDNAFAENLFSGELALPNSVKTIGGHAFDSCGFSGILTLGKRLKTIGPGAFKDCNFTGDLYIPNSVKQVDNHAFSCDFTGTISIPKGIIKLGNKAFQGNTKIQKIVNKSNQRIKASQFLYEDQSAYFTSEYGEIVKYKGKMGKGTFRKSVIRVDAVYILDDDSSFPLDKVYLEKGERKKLRIWVDPGNATNRKVTWKSSNTKVATISKNGVVTAKGGGTATVTVTTVDGNYKDTCKIIVPKTVRVKDIKLSKKAFVNKGQTITLKPTIKPKNATNKNVSWTSSDPSIVSVDKNGVIKGLKSGIAYITVTTEDGNKTAKCKVTVRQ